MHLELDNVDAVIFDLGSTVFTENHVVALKYLNVSHLLRFSAIGRNPNELRERSDVVMIEKFGKGIRRPKLVEDWLSGKLSPKQALEKYNEMMKTVKNSHNTKLLLSDVGKITFTPEILSEILELNRNTMKVVKQIKASGKPVYLTGNLDNDTYTILLQKYPELNLFTDTILSQNIHCLKPETKFYETVVKHWKLVPERTIFFENEQDDAKLARKVGFDVRQI